MPLGVLSLGLLLLFGSTAFGQSPPASASVIKDVSLEPASTIAFMLYDDKTISAYDVSSREVTISRVALVPQARNIYRLFGNADGSTLAVLYETSSGKLRTALFNLSSDGGKRFVAGPDYLLGERVDQGRVGGAFSPDGETLFVTYGLHTLFSLSATAPRQRQTTVGNLPSAVAFADTGSVLVANKQSGDVSIVDAAGLTVRATVKVGTSPDSVIFNSVTKNAYVSNSGSDDVSVVDTRKGTVVHTLKVGKAPASLAYDGTNGAVYVANNSSGSVSVISPDFSLRNIELGSPAYFKSSPLTLTFRNKDRQLFVVNTSEAKYFVYDANTSRLTTEAETNPFPRKILAPETIPSAYLLSWDASSLAMLEPGTFSIATASATTGGPDTFFSRPQSVAIDSSTNRIFVSNMGADYVTVIDGTTQKPVAKIVVGKSIQNLLLDDISRKLYAVSPADSALYAVDISGTAYPVISIPLAQQPRGGALNRETNTLYYSNSAADRVSVIDGTRNAVIKTIDLPADSFPLLNAVDEGRNKVYVALYGGDSIAVINGATNAIEKFIPTGGRPIWVRYLPELDRIFATVENGKKVLVVDPSSANIIQTLSVDAEPYRIFFDATTSYVYVNQRNKDIVFVFRATGAGKDFELVDTLPLPYWGETDARPYNLVSYNEKTNLAYFTSIANKVVVVRVVHDANNLMQGIWQATIHADGSVTTAADTSPESFLKRVATWQYLEWGLAGVVAVLILAAVVFWRRRRVSTPLP